MKNIKNMLKTLKGLGEARKIVKEIEPDVVIGMGGYICGPVILAAKKRKIPTLLHESNAFPGIAVKLLAKKTDVILMGFEERSQKATQSQENSSYRKPNKNECRA